MQYGALVIAYLFLGGAAGGAFLVMSIWSLSLHRSFPHRSAQVRREFRILRGRTYAIATLVLAASMLCLLWDLDYPERALLIFLSARPTVLTFGACVLSALLGVGVLLTLANLLHLKIFFEPRQTRARWHMRPVGRSRHGIYGRIPLQQYRHRLLAYRLPRGAFLLFRPVFGTLHRFAHRLLRSKRDEAHLRRQTAPERPPYLPRRRARLYGGVPSEPHGRTRKLPRPWPRCSPMPWCLPAALIGAVGLGIVAPFALESYALLRKEQRAIPVSDFVCLIGAFCLRWTVIVCGVH